VKLIKDKVTDEKMKPFIESMIEELETNEIN